MHVMHSTKPQGQNLDFNAIDTFKDDIFKTKDALNGIERLTAAKSKAEKLIDSLKFINKAQSHMQMMKL